MKIGDEVIYIDDGVHGRIDHFSEDRACRECARYTEDAIKTHPVGILWDDEPGEGCSHEPLDYFILVLKQDTL